MTLAPFDAVLVVSFGGPEGPEDVMPFLRNVTEGRNIPEERLAEVANHYDAFGGVSPMGKNTDEFVAALAAALRDRGIDAPVALGNRNWHPYLADTLGQLHADGHRRIVALLTSAYSSYSGCRQYREDIARALAKLGPAGEGMEVAKIASFHQSAGFVAAQVDAIAPALADGVRSKVLFTTHSIPNAMDDCTGSASHQPRRSYAGQHLQTARLVVERLQGDVDWELVYCSRSGSPRTPWLEPDIGDRIAELPTTDPDVKRVVVVPFGFLNDHMEVVHDLDDEAAEAAEEAGLEFVRVPTAHIHDAFIASLCDRLEARAAEARGEEFQLDSLCPEWPTTCAADCCLLRPDAPYVPTVCQEN